jgi:hypothetical protein
MDVALVREEIDRRIRPGQAGGSLTVDRAPRSAALRPTGHAHANRWDPVAGEDRTYALFGRGRYGSARYASG